MIHRRRNVYNTAVWPYTTRLHYTTLAKMKRQNALTTTLKTSTLYDVPLLNKLRKTPILTIKKIVFFGGFLDFFRNGTSQRVLHFSYLTSPDRKIKNFWVIMGFWDFSDPWQPGSNELIFLDGKFLFNTPRSIQKHLETMNM